MTLRVGPFSNLFFPVEDEIVIVLPIDMKMKLGVSEKDAAGNVIDPAGPFVWNTSDPAVVALTDNGDGTVYAIPVGPLGSV